MISKKIINRIVEASGKGLTIFDIDETLFKTKARVQVKVGRKTVKILNNASQLKRGFFFIKFSE